jgi:hypothetical protein
MYRIYMPVDMVLAITHSKMRRQRNNDRVNKERIESMRLACAVASASENGSTYVKDDEWQRREKIVNSIKNSNCMEMFRFW